MPAFGFETVPKGTESRDNTCVRGGCGRELEAALSEPSTNDPLWKQVPSWFIFGDQDRNIPVGAHRIMAERASAKSTQEIPARGTILGATAVGDDSPRWPTRRRAQLGRRSPQSGTVLPSGVALFSGSAHADEKQMHAGNSFGMPTTWPINSAGQRTASPNAPNPC